VYRERSAKDLLKNFSEDYEGEGRENSGQGGRKSRRTETLGARSFGSI